MDKCARHTSRASCAYRRNGSSCWQSPQTRLPSSCFWYVEPVVEDANASTSCSPYLYCTETRFMIWSRPGVRRGGGNVPARTSFAKFSYVVTPVLRRGFVACLSFRSSSVSSTLACHIASCPSGTIATRADVIAQVVRQVRKEGRNS